MTEQEAIQIRKEYAATDEAFRAAKKDKRTPYPRVTALKAKRDALESKVDEALKFLKNIGKL